MPFSPAKRVVRAEEDDKGSTDPTASGGVGSAAAKDAEADGDKSKEEGAVTGVEVKGAGKGAQTKQENSGSEKSSLPDSKAAAEKKEGQNEGVRVVVWACVCVLWGCGHF